MGRAFGLGLLWALSWVCIGIFVLFMMHFFYAVLGSLVQSPNHILESTVDNFSDSAWFIAFAASAGFAVGWGTGMKGVRGAFKTIGFSLAIAPVLSLITILPLYGIAIDAYSARSEKLSSDDWLALGILYAGLTAVFVLIALLAYFGDLTKPRKKR